MQRREPRPFAGARGRPGVASGADALSRRPGKPDSARRRQSPHGRCRGPRRAPSTTWRTGLGSPAVRRFPGSATGPGTLRRRPRERVATRRAPGADRMTHPAAGAILRQHGDPRVTRRATGADRIARAASDAILRRHRERQSLVGRPEPPGGASGPGGSPSGGGAASSVGPPSLPPKPPVPPDPDALRRRPGPPPGHRLPRRTAPPRLEAPPNALRRASSPSCAGSPGRSLPGPSEARSGTIRPAPILSNSRPFSRSANLPGA